MTETPEPAPMAYRKKKRLWGWLFVVAFTIFLGAGIVGNWFTGKPKGLGANKGRLANCPNSPNCVCSQETRSSHQVEALAYAGEGKAAFSRLAKVIHGMPRTKIVTQTDNYMHVEFTTGILRFVDDVEFLLSEDENVIHVRSASRVGHSDLGTNHKRVETIRAAFAAESNE